MEAIVLAGGFGTRLQKIVSDLPKPMAPIAGQPFLEILLSMLGRKGFRRIVLSLGYLSEKIVDHFGNNFAGMELINVIEDTPLGTGGAVRKSLQHCISDHVYVFNGDTYLDIEVQGIEALWQKNHLPIIVAREVEDSTRFGRLITENDRVLHFYEKGVSGRGLINAGSYVLPRNILDEFQLGYKFSLESDFLASAVERQKFNFILSHGKFIDIGIPEDYEYAQSELFGI
jgi:D-glycero-alpha-D-manno-heptose 1-phosphate guanylyltransferase